MYAHVVMLHNPFQPERNKDVFPVEERISIRGWLDQKGIEEFSRPTICLVNGQAVLRGAWAMTHITDQDVIAFVGLPQGGGGGGGKILRTVLSIAVAVALPGLGSAVAGAIGVTSAIGTSLITAGLGFLGNTLLNVLVPPPVPSNSAANAGFGNTPNPSPTYSLQSQGNQARLSQPIPVIYGRHIVFPDLAATPYTVYEDNDQFLFQLHAIGQGEYDVEQIRIEDTPISSFEEIDFEVVEPGSDVTLFEPDVVTAPEVSGQELLSVDDGGDFVGPFIANPAQTQTTSLGIDIVFPRGLFFANDNGGLSSRTVTWEVEARTIDDDGTVTGSWTQLGAETFTAATNTPQRVTYDYPVAAGRYEVRAIRTNAKSFSSRVGNDIRWGGLKSTLIGEQNFGDITMLALKMRATDNLSQRSSRLVNCIVTRKLPVWDAENGWSAPQATQSIAWALADICRAYYGARLEDSRIDLGQLYDLDQIWAARNDTFNAVFDNTVTVWEALGRVSRCGRTVVFMQSGVIRFMRDDQKTLPIGMYSPRNIVRNSLKIQYVLTGEDTADSVTVEFFSDQTWKPDEIDASLPDSMTEQPARVQLFGCTNEAQALREGLYMAAANRYRRRIVTFQTELEGLIPTYGDLIAITHDMPSWGQGAEVVSVDGQTLFLSEPLIWDENGGDHYVALRKDDGSISGPWLVLQGSDPREVILQDDIGFTPYTGQDKERTHAAFGVGENWTTLARITGIRPRDSLVEITAVAENNAVHLADIQ
jgi:sulfur carrier protein ThiS